MELRCSKCGQVPPKSEWENTLAPYGMHLRHIREFCKKTKVLKVKQMSPKRARREDQLIAYKNQARPAAFERAHYRCEETGCGNAATEIHHVHSRVGSALVDMKNVIALCVGCHKHAQRHPAISRPRHDEIRRRKP